MARVTLSVPDELLDLVRQSLPHLNISGALQEALRGRLSCSHKRLACAECAAPLEARELVDEALSRFYGDALWNLDELVRTGGTAEGSARVLKNVAERHGVTRAINTPLPRATRANREAWIKAERRRERTQ
jgi:post-segregation antitoxin (ccd killing protein)